MISRWAMELLGYTFTDIHRPAKMMVDVDALTRQYTPEFKRYVNVAAVLSARDRACRPSAYRADTFSSQPIQIHQEVPANSVSNIPIFTKTTISTIPQQIPTYKSPPSYNDQPKNLLTTLPPAIQCSESIPPAQNTPTNLAATNILDSTVWETIQWITVDDTIGSFETAIHSFSTMQWDVINLFSTEYAQAITLASPQTAAGSVQCCMNMEFSEYIWSKKHIFDINSVLGCNVFYLQYVHPSFPHWLTQTTLGIRTLIEDRSTFTFCRI